MEIRRATLQDMPGVYACCVAAFKDYIKDGEGDFQWMDVLAAEPKGTGVGRALLTFCEDYIRAQGKHQCRLYTHVKYTRSQQIYLRQGYTIYDRVQEEGFDRYYMKKDL